MPQNTTIETTMTFEEMTRGLQIMTGATGDELDALTQRARDLAASFAEVPSTADLIRKIKDLQDQKAAYIHAIETTDDAEVKRCLRSKRKAIQEQIESRATQRIL